MRRVSSPPSFRRAPRGIFGFAQVGMGGAVRFMVPTDQNSCIARSHALIRCNTRARSVAGSSTDRSLSSYWSASRR